MTRRMKISGYRRKLLPAGVALAVLIVGIGISIARAEDSGHITLSCPAA